MAVSGGGRASGSAGPGRARRGPTRRSRTPAATAVCALALTVAAAGQDPVERAADPSLTGATQQEPGAPDTVSQETGEQDGRGAIYGFFANLPGDDQEPIVYAGGVRFADPESGLTVRADRAALLADATAARGVVRGFLAEDGLPRRAPRPPRSRRAVDPDQLRARLAAFVGSLRGSQTAPAPMNVDAESIRSLYLEGDVTVTRDGVEVLRCASLHWSGIDDRAVLEDVTLRLDADTGGGGRPLFATIRAPELVRQAGRFVGRDVSVTTSRAGEPTYDVVSGEIEVVERERGFEIRARDNALRIGGVTILPVPDQTWNTADQNNLLIKGINAGYSGNEGAQIGVELGSSFNETGGAVHEALTGRPGEEFRGDWRLDVGWIEKRGFPLRPDVQFRGGDLYEGRIRGFWMQDTGRNFREITRDLAGNTIDNEDRRLVHTQSRVNFSDNTRLDISFFDASDEAVWSEFYRGDYLEAERPETSLHLRHAEGARIATLTGRFDVAGYGYTDGRALAPEFLEELPRATFDWFSLPVADLPYDGKLLATTSTDIAALRYSPEGDAPMARDDDTLRLDQRIEFAAPYQLGPVRARPFVEGRYTWYEDTVFGESDGRAAMRAGIELGSRLQRVFFDDAGNAAWRHVIAPTVRLDHTFLVEGSPDRYFQFDETDAVQRGGNVRVGLLQRLETRSEDPLAGVRDAVWLDVAQNIDPDGTRDDDGDGGSHTLGLLEFEAILRPFPRGTDAPDLQFVVEGEHDWDESELRTFNNFVQWRVGNVTWLGEYRSDRTASGQVGAGVSTTVRGRWRINGRTLYDLERSEYVNYSVGLSRIDPDWVLTFGIVYDNIFDDVTARIDFEPLFSGLFQRRSRRAIGGADFAPTQHWNY